MWRVQFSRLRCSWIVGLMLTAPVSNAADTLAPVEVTGSRIRHLGQESASPVQMLDRRYMELTGLGTLIELLQRALNAGTGLTDIGGGIISKDVSDGQRRMLRLSLVWKTP